MPVKRSYRNRWGESSVTSKVDDREEAAALLLHGGGSPWLSSNQKAVEFGAYVYSHRYDRTMRLLDRCRQIKRCDGGGTNRVLRLLLLDHLFVIVLLAHVVFEKVLRRFVTVCATSVSSGWKMASR